MSTRAQITERVSVVYKLQLAGLPRHDIVTICREKHGWDVCLRTIDSYIAEATKRFEKRAERADKAEFGKALARYEAQYGKADARKDHRAAAIIVEKICTLQGLQKAAKMEHSGPGGGPIVVGALGKLEEEIVAAVAAAISGSDEGDMGGHQTPA